MVWSGVLGKNRYFILARSLIVLPATMKVLLPMWRIVRGCFLAGSIQALWTSGEGEVVPDNAHSLPRSGPLGPDRYR